MPKPTLTDEEWMRAMADDELPRFHEEEEGQLPAVAVQFVRDAIRDAKAAGRVIYFEVSNETL